jgi:hypothetical protein
MRNQKHDQDFGCDEWSGMYCFRAICNVQQEGFHILGIDDI